MGGQLALGRGGGSRVGDVCVVHTLAMPVRSEAEGDRPVGWVLVDGSIPFVSHLISVVLELLPKRAELRPNFVARRAGHAVLPGERRDGMPVAFWDGKSGSGAAGYEQEGKNQENPV